jgi:hypothetical protein
VEQLLIANMPLGPARPEDDEETAEEEQPGERYSPRPFKRPDRIAV